MDSLTRFVSKVDFSGDCWTWKAAKQPNGYGRFHDGDRVWPAHRWMFVRCGRVIIPGQELDHLCRNRACVNPFHLESVSRRENVMRGENFMAQKAKQTHCIHGHEYTPENTYRGVRGTRQCRECVLAYAGRRYRGRNR